MPVRCLTNKGTGELIAQHSTGHCIWKGRIAFLDADGEPKKNANFGCCLIHFGSGEEDFAEAFRDYGNIYLNGNRTTDEQIPPEPPESENWIFEKTSKKKLPLYCTNFDWQNRDAKLPEALKLRLRDRSNSRLEKICDWAIADGLADSVAFLKKGDPAKLLNGSNNEAEIILRHPEAAREIIQAQQSRTFHEYRRWPGEIGEIFHPGDWVRLAGTTSNSAQYVVSEVAILKNEAGQKPQWQIKLCNVLTGSKQKMPYRSKLELVKPAPDFGEAFLTSPYQGLKVGSRVQTLKALPVPANIPAWVKDYYPVISGFLSDGLLALSLASSDQHGNIFITDDTIVVPRTDVVVNTNICNPPVSW